MEILHFLTGQTGIFNFLEVSNGISRSFVNKNEAEATHKTFTQIIGELVWEKIAA